MNSRTTPFSEPFGDSATLVGEFYAGELDWLSMLIVDDERDWHVVTPGHHFLTYSRLEMHDWGAGCGVADHGWTWPTSDLFLMTWWSYGTTHLELDPKGSWSLCDTLNTQANSKDIWKALFYHWEGNWQCGHCAEQETQAQFRTNPMGNTGNKCHPQEEIQMIAFAKTPQRDAASNLKLYFSPYGPQMNPS